MIFNMLTQGVSDWELIAEAHLGTYSTTSTTASTITFSNDLIIPAKAIDPENYLPCMLICTLDLNGARNGYLLGSLVTVGFQNSGTTYRNIYTNSSTAYCFYIDENGELQRIGQVTMTNLTGVYPYSIASATGKVTYRGRYNSTHNYTIDGDYYAYAYAIKAPLNILDN